MALHTLYYVGAYLGIDMHKRDERECEGIFESIYEEGCKESEQFQNQWNEVFDDFGSLAIEIDAIVQQYSSSPEALYQALLNGHCCADDQQMRPLRVLLRDPRISNLIVNEWGKNLLTSPSNFHQQFWQAGITCALARPPSFRKLRMPITKLSEKGISLRRITDELPNFPVPSLMNVILEWDEYILPTVKEDIDTRELFVERVAHPYVRAIGKQGIDFGFFSAFGASVQKTAQGLNTIRDGQLPAFPPRWRPDPPLMAIWLCWPGYNPIRVTFEVHQQATRAELAKLISRQLILWAEVQAYALPHEGCEKWKLGPETELTSDVLWLIGIRYIGGNDWLVYLQFGKD